MSDRAIYLTVDGSERHGEMAARCLASIRAFDRSIPIYVFAYGSPARAVEQAAARARATLIREPARTDVAPTFLKWLPTERLEETCVLYLDTDTWCARDPNELFDRYDDHDFYARVECGTRGASSRLIGTYIVHPQVSWPAMSRLRRALDARALPVFNTGVMLFNGGAHRTIARELDAMLEIGRGFASGEVPYPCTNPHIAEEIAATLALGRVPGLGAGSLRAKDAPWYIEVLSGDAADLGVVVHVWSAYYPYFLERIAGRRARARFDAMTAMPIAMPA